MGGWVGGRLVAATRAGLALGYVRAPKKAPGSSKKPRQLPCGVCFGVSRPPGLFWGLPAFWGSFWGTYKMSRSA